MNNEQVMYHHPNAFSYTGIIKSLRIFQQMYLVVQLCCHSGNRICDQDRTKRSCNSEIETYTDILSFTQIYNSAVRLFEHIIIIICNVWSSYFGMSLLINVFETNFRFAFA